MPQAASKSQTAFGGGYENASACLARSMIRKWSIAASPHVFGAMSDNTTSTSPRAVKPSTCASSRFTLSDKEKKNPFAFCFCSRLERADAGSWF